MLYTQGLLIHHCALYTPGLLIHHCTLYTPGLLIHHVRRGSQVKEAVHQIPALLLDAAIQPITRTVLRVKLSITADFTWNDKVLY